MIKHVFKHVTSFILTLILVSTCFSATVFADSEEADAAEQVVVNVESGAEKSNSFITINEGLEDKASGLNLIMCGLTESNKDAVVSKINSTFDPSTEQAIKYIDYSFVDADKFNAEVDEESLHPYDHALCWAGSISNLLWMAGWAEGLSNPMSGKEFLSEDDVFTYYNSRFMDSGSDCGRGLEFFFQGNYYDIADHPHTHLNNNGDRSECGVQTASDGLLKNIAAECLIEKGCIDDDVSKIAELENICTGTGEDTLFQISVGELFSGGSTHSVNAVGLVIDPNETSLEKRYKAILLANSDDDGYPDTLTDDATDAEKEADKAKRPNSYNLYPLKLVTSEDGKTDWEIVGYSSERTALYSFTGLKVKTDKSVTEATETEGTQNTLENVDLFVENVFTTDSKEAVSDYPDTLAKEKTVTEFKYGKAVNLNFYLQNRTSIILDETYTTEKAVPVTYTVVKRSSTEEDNEIRPQTLALALEAGGEIIKSGTYESELPLYSDSQNTCFIKLNREDGKLVKWDEGTYDVYLNINSDEDGKRVITEAYYKNNEASTTFKVLSETPETTTESETTTEQETTTIETTTVPETTVTQTTAVQTTIAANNNGNATTTAANTADENDPYLYLAVLILALSVLSCTVYLLRKKS